MKPAWITRRYRLQDARHHLEDEDGVLSADALQVVSDAAALTQAVRARCAARLRAARARQQQRLRQQREHCEARVMAQVASLSRSLHDERQALREAAAELVTQVARDALRRLLVELPEAWPARSSVALVLAEWSALDLKDEAVLAVNPDDLALVDARPADTPWSLKADPAVARGSCVLSHSAGTVQADFHASLQALQAALQAVPPPAVDASAPDAPSGAGAGPAIGAAPEPAASATSTASAASAVQGIGPSADIGESATPDTAATASTTNTAVPAAARAGATRFAAPATPATAPAAAPATAATAVTAVAATAAAATAATAATAAARATMPAAATPPATAAAAVAPAASIASPAPAHPAVHLPPSSPRRGGTHPSGVFA